jgi:hypothetical protein
LIKAKYLFYFFLSLYNKKEVEKIGVTESEMYDEIDMLLSNEYVTLQSNEKASLQFFDPKEKPITEVEKKWQNDVVKKIRFLVVNMATGAEQKLDVGKRSARLIVGKLKEGHRYMELQRVGSGKETLYIPTPIQQPSKK